MITKVISGCSKHATDGPWCPVEYDGHCMLDGKVDTYGDGVPTGCPLKKSPILLKLKRESKWWNKMKNFFWKTKGVKIGKIND